MVKKNCKTMSKKSNVIFLCPPWSMAIAREDVSFKEAFVGSPEVCPKCHGAGWYWIEDERTEAVKKTCECCEGAGELVPVVSINWVASKRD